MIIIASVNKLTGANQNVIDYIKESNKDGNSLALIVDANIPLDVFEMVYEYGKNLSILKNASNKIELGFKLGMLIGNTNEKVVLLFDEELSIDKPNVEVGIPERKERKPRTKTSRVKEEKPSEDAEVLPYPEAAKKPRKKIENESAYDKVMKSNTYKRLVVEAVTKATNKEDSLKTQLLFALGSEKAEEVYEDVKIHFEELKGVAV